MVKLELLLALTIAVLGCRAYTLNDFLRLNHNDQRKCLMFLSVHPFLLVSFVLAKISSG